MGIIVDACVWIDVERVRLSAALQSQGRGAEFRVQDIWIASQAIQHGFPVLTKNKKDFQDIPGLDLIVIGG